MKNKLGLTCFFVFTLTLGFSCEFVHSMAPNPSRVQKKRESSRRYYEKNGEMVKKAQGQHRKENVEKVREKWRLYYKKNVEKEKERNRNNREKVKERSRRNREKVKERQRLYREKNRERQAALDREEQIGQLGEDGDEGPNGMVDVEECEGDEAGEDIEEDQTCEDADQGVYSDDSGLLPAPEDGGVDYDDDDGVYL